VVIDSKRNIFKVWRFIIVPICVNKDASIGEWILEIKTDVETINKPFREILEYSFEVQ
jgi:hypothetical protein